ncbi:MAG: DUF5977 domain-containing protein [Chitinophagaceae bacterium]
MKMTLPSQLTRKRNLKIRFVLTRLTGFCLFISFAVNANAQFDSTGGFTKYVVDKTSENSRDNLQKKDSAGPMAVPPVGCTISGTSSVIGGNNYTYLLSCGDGKFADYWGVSNGTVVSRSGDRITIKWCNPGCTSGIVRAYRDATGQLATKTVTITSSGSPLNGGSISNPTQGPINYNSAPAQVNASAGIGGYCSGTYNYTWQESTDNFQTSIINISGATGLNYQPGLLTVTTWFRRLTGLSCTDAYAYTSNVAMVSVAPQLGGGSISSGNQLIHSGSIPAVVNATVASGGNCSMTYSYQWQQSTDNVNFTDISTATGQNYQPKALTVVTYFRRRASCNGEIAYTSNTSTISMILPANGGCITSGNQKKLVGSIPDVIQATAASNGNCNGNYIYQWQSSSDNSYFTDMPGATSQNLGFSTAISKTTWFQRRTTCGTEIQYTNSVGIFIDPLTTFYNVEKSGPFTRNNCEAGFLGNTLTYIVPAYTYSSTLNQDDADAKAQNDVNTNGQRYVNNIGICTSTTVAVSLKNYFIGTSWPPYITVKFKQGNTIIQSNVFSSAKMGSVDITLPAGTYQMEFTMPSNFSNYFVVYDKNNPNEIWDNDGNKLIVTTGNVIFNGGIHYTIGASDAF